MSLIKKFSGAVCCGGLLFLLISSGYLLYFFISFILGMIFMIHVFIPWWIHDYEAPRLKPWFSAFADESTHDLTVGVSSLESTSSGFGKPTITQSGFYRDKQKFSAELVRS